MTLMNALPKRESKSESGHGKAYEINTMSL
jgi:hypothetical protein